MSEDYRARSEPYLGHDWLGWAYVKQGRYPEAIAEREKVAELSQRSGPQLSGLGYVYAVAGRRAEALAILKDSKRNMAGAKSIGQHLAAIYYGLGDKDQAFAWLEKDFEERSAELQHIMDTGRNLNNSAATRVRRPDPAHGTQPVIFRLQFKIR